MRDLQDFGYLVVSIRSLSIEAKAKAGFRPADSDGKAKVLSKKQLRNKRQAKKNKLKAKKMAEKFAASTGASAASS